MRRLFLILALTFWVAGCAHQPPQTYAHQVAAAGGLHPIQDPIDGQVHAYAGPSRVIAWMPLDMAPSRAHAHEQVMARLRAAVQQALPEHQVSRGSAGGGDYIVIEGPDCAQPCRFGGEDMGRPMIRTAPAWLGGYKAYAWLASDWRDVGWWRTAYPSQAGLDATQTMKFYRRVSAALPEWLFLYLAPGEHGTAQALVLQQGRVSAFVPQAP